LAIKRKAQRQMGKPLIFQGKEENRADSLIFEFIAN
jgi:hypothetical protein